MKACYLCFSAVVILTACGDRTARDTATTDTAKATVTTTGTPTFVPSLGVDIAAMTRTPGGAYYRDINVGSGALADSGKQVSIHYRGQLPDGTQFDASQPPGPPIVFRLFSGQVVRGFDEGINGMKVGGKRVVAIPPALGYGASGNGPVPPNAWMVFMLDLVSVQP